MLRALLALTVYIYSILGVTLFAKVKFNGALDKYANFTTLRHSFLTLARAVTGESWHEITDASGRKFDLYFQCEYNPTYESYKKAG